MMLGSSCWLRAGLLALLVGMAGTLSGCDCDDDQNVTDCLFSGDFDSEQARVRLFNQLTDEGSTNADDITVDLLAGTESDPLVEDRGYDTSATPGTDGVDLDSDEQDVAFTLRRSDDNLELVSNRQLRLEDGDTYTLVAMGDVDNIASVRLERFQVDTAPPTGGQARVRFIHTLSRLDVSPLRLDVLRGGTLLVDALDFGTASAFVALTPDAGGLQVSLRDVDGDIVATPSCSITAGGRFEAVLAYQSFGDTDDGDIRLFCHAL